MMAERAPEATIYAVYHPDTSEVMYVGCTTRPKQRFSKHRHGHLDARKPMDWAALMLAAGKAPVVKALERVPKEQGVDRERYWIAYYRSQGEAGLNTGDGGWTSSGAHFHFTQQHRRALSGEQNGRARLTERDILAVRASTEPLAVLAARFGVSDGQISKIRLRQRWTHMGE